MPNITRRTTKTGTSFLIRVYLGEKQNGKQEILSKTWRPAPGMTERQVEKELNRQALLFEEQAKTGLVSASGSMRFSEYAELWLATAQLAPKTHERYIGLLTRINAAIGHIRLDKLQAHHLEAFYLNLAEAGVKHQGYFAMSSKLDGVMKQRKLSLGVLAAQSSTAAATVRAARLGQRISIPKAEQIAAALQIKVDELFTVQQSTSGLASKTILHHHRLISAILEKAKRTKIVPFNVAKEHATAPKVQRKEATYLDTEQAQHIVALLLADDDVRVKAAIILLLYSGVRRGELCGLEWRDIDSNRQMIHINRASQYQKGRGVVEVPTKTLSSERSIKMPLIVFDVLDEYRAWWDIQREKHGDMWQGAKQRLFIQSDGKPINPDTLNYWLSRFIEQHSLPHFTPHSCRHTFASLQLANGVDIRTLQARTGHAQASTLVNTYSHVMKTAAEAAADVVDEVLTPKGLKMA